MNVLNGLDGKSVLVGALVVGGLVATQGGLVPLLLVGGLVYLVGGKQGWWGTGPRRWGSEPRGHRSEGVPPFFAEWHRQSHASDPPHLIQPGQPVEPAQAPAPAPAQPRAAEARIPVTQAPVASAASVVPAAPTEPLEPAAVSASVPPAPPKADDRRTGPESGVTLV